VALGVEKCQKRLDGKTPQVAAYDVLALAEGFNTVAYRKSGQLPEAQGCTCRGTRAPRSPFAATRTRCPASEADLPSATLRGAWRPNPAHPNGPIAAPASSDLPDSVLDEVDICEGSASDFAHMDAASAGRACV
jgi:hypothetical protein